jgi:hypothetical protein
VGELVAVKPNSSIPGWLGAAIPFFGFAGVFIIPKLAQCRPCQ